LTNAAINASRPLATASFWHLSSLRTPFSLEKIDPRMGRPAESTIEAAKNADVAAVDRPE
jgi:hypothetical protein